MFGCEHVDRRIVRVVQRFSRRQPVIVGGVVAGVVVVALVATIGLTVAARGSSSEAVAPSPTIGDTSDVSAAVVAPPSTSVPTSSTSTTSTTSSTSSTSSSTSSTSTTSTTSSTSTTIDPAALLPTLREGDTGPEVITLQRMLNHVIGSELVADGRFGPATTAAIRSLQVYAGLAVTGDADHATRTLLIELDAGRSAALPTWPFPSIGNGGADGCQVAVVGDSLMAYSSSLHAAALRDINCAPAVDAVGGRSLAWGWQCRVGQPGGRTPLLLLADPEPGNATCAPSGLEVLELMRNAQALGDLVVNALGTNDAGLFDEARWTANWNTALDLTGGRPMIFLTVKARPGSDRSADLDRYSAVVRRWCDSQARCHLADWALTPVANDPASYVDSVHLTRSATEARARFIRDAVLALFEGRPLPNPQTLPTVTPTLPPAPPTTPPPPAPSTTTTSTTTTTATTSPTTTTQPTATTVAPNPTTTTVAPKPTTTTTALSSSTTTTLAGGETTNITPTTLGT